MPLNIKILSASKVRQQYILDGEAEYAIRIKPFAKLSLVELDSAKGFQGSENEQRKKTSQQFISSVSEKDFVVLLHEQGKTFNSPAFAAWLQEQMNRGQSSLTIGIGAPCGWHESALQRSNLLLSLSPLTFPSHIARLVLIEQIYRALSILSGSPYHK